MGVINIEVSGDRYLKFNSDDLHYTDDCGVMIPVSNIVQRKPLEQGEIHIIASKDKYSMIDLHADSSLSSQTDNWVSRDVKRCLREYNQRVYNKNTPFLLLDSSEYLYESKGRDGGRFNLERSYIKTIKRKKTEQGRYETRTIAPNYPNIWKENGKICEGSASITTGTNTMEQGLTKMVFNFFTTRFNRDLTVSSMNKTKYFEKTVLDYYIDRRVEQLGLEGHVEQEFRTQAESKNNKVTSTVYEEMYFFSVLGIDYANVY